MTSIDKSVVHVAIFTVSGEEGGASCDEAKLAGLIDRCRKQIPGLVELFVGRHEPSLLGSAAQVSSVAPHQPKTKSFAMVSRHISAEALETFLSHPDYVAVANYLAAVSVHGSVKSAFHSISKL